MHNIYMNGMAYNSDNFDCIYQWLLGRLMTEGKTFEGRNGKTFWGTPMIDVDMQLEFPVTRLRKLPVAKIMGEFWFDIGYSSNIEDLGDAQAFWKPFADENGDLGASSYNRFFRRYPSVDPNSLEPNEFTLGSTNIDQIRKVISELSFKPNSRRAVIYNGHPGFEYPENGCPPCHGFLVFTPDCEGGLSLTVTARSNDVIFGVPLDLFRYGMLLHYICYYVDMKPSRLLMPSANTHLYESNIEGAIEMVTNRKPVDCKPQLIYDGEAFCLDNYFPHKFIKFNLST